MSRPVDVATFNHQPHPIGIFTQDVQCCFGQIVERRVLIALGGNKLSVGFTNFERTEGIWGESFGSIDTEHIQTSGAEVTIGRTDR